MYRNDKVILTYADYSKQIQGELTLGICNTNTPYLVEGVHNILSAEEMREYLQKKSEKRKREFYWSRTLAKTILCSAYKEEHQLTDIRIAKGFLNNPIIKSKEQGYGIGITHCEDYAAIIVFPEEMVLGLDMEKLDWRKVKGINTILTDKERKLCPLNYDNNNFVLAVWTMKEALVKFLKLGLSVNFDIMQIASVEWSDTGFKSGYRFFPTLDAYTFFEEDFVYTIVCTNNLVLERKKTDIKVS
ncbi:4'-phosphopantetheinyl transferase superfamily protein [Anaerocolumna sp. AGMB13020]|uniref:4'-phosphopantetheinyl transferase family protein n=1 Tax=Anaerocolumna sp. AGMB13020 TaxID=3081750 RepID=UPI0029553CF5|nr:4'-phosphopantetheinyl transferase superfamily protein [Anaerocolumna sp. AGMB13020]WOO38584.1 4'-phosphopantetheinyl transferase superfamily protein [Anaerocolumna sp. AGMB13020]